MCWKASGVKMFRSFPRSRVTFSHLGAFAMWFLVIQICLMILLCAVHVSEWNRVLEILQFAFSPAVPKRQTLCYVAQSGTFPKETKICFEHAEDFRKVYCHRQSFSCVWEQKASNNNTDTVRMLDGNSFLPGKCEREKRKLFADGGERFGRIFACFMITLWLRETLILFPAFPDAHAGRGTFTWISLTLFPIGFGSGVPMNLAIYGIAHPKIHFLFVINYDTLRAEREDLCQNKESNKKIAFQCSDSTLFV